MNIVCHIIEKIKALLAKTPANAATEAGQQCVTDAQRFLAAWGDKARALGWTPDELFCLHEPPKNRIPATVGYRATTAPD